MNEEILNIEFNVKQMVLRALNKFGMITSAATALSIGERTLYNYKNRFNIKKIADTKQYSIIKNEAHKNN